MKKGDDDHSMSPEKRNALSKLRETELALDKQSQAIQTMLSKLDTEHSDTTTVGYSTYSSLHTYPRMDFNHLPVQRSKSVLQSRNSTADPLMTKLNNHVAATVNFTKQTTEMSGELRRSKDILSSRKKERPLESSGLLAELDSSRHFGVVVGSAKKHSAYSDGEESIYGTDIIKASQAQLARIREERASTLALRLQQKQEALQLAEQLRLNALHEVRHKAAMESAVRHFEHKHTWRVIKYLFNNVKLRANYTMAAYKWKVMNMFDVIHKLIRRVRINASSDAPYMVLRLRAGWRRFQYRYLDTVHNHLRNIETDMIVHNYRLNRSCRAVMNELRRLVRRRVMTGALISVYRERSACKKAFAVFRRKLLGQCDRAAVVEETLVRLEDKQMRGALHRLADFARTEGRKRRVMYKSHHAQLLETFVALGNFTQRRAHQSRCIADATHFHAENSLFRHLHKWFAFVGARKYRKSCRAMATTHTSDIRAKTDAHWLREHVRKHFRKWYARVKFNRKRSLPTKRYKSKKFRARVVLILNEWRQRVKTAKLKRRSDRAKIRLFQLRRGFNWFWSELQNRISVLKWQRLAISAPRTRLRRKYMSHGFAHYRALIVQHRAQRMLVKKAKMHRFQIHMRRFIAILLLRVVARKKRRVATEARLVRLARRCFKNWRKKAARKLKKRSIKSTKALIRSKRHSLLRAWIARTGERLERAASIKKGRIQRVKFLLATAFSNWTKLAERGFKLQSKGVRTVKISAARRLTFLHRWFHYVEDRHAKRAHVREFGVHRAHKQLRQALSVLLQPCLRRNEENKFIASYRDEVLAPLLARRCLRKWGAKHYARVDRLADPRLHHCDERMCRKALRAWRKFCSVRVDHAQDALLGDRNRAIVTSLRAFSRWRYLASLRGALIESARCAARAYRRRYFAPAFKTWLRNTTSLAHQFDARYLKHGNVYVHKLASRLLGAFRRKLAHRKMLKNSVRRAQILRSHSALEHHLHILHDHAKKRRNYKLMKKNARNQRARVLMRIAFGGFLTALKESVSPGHSKAERYHDRRMLRMAIKTLRAIRRRRKGSKRALVHSTQKVRRFAKRLLVAWALKFRTRKRKIASASGCYRRHVCRKFLSFWVSSHVNRVNRVDGASAFKKAARKNLLLKSSGVLSPRSPTKRASALSVISPKNKRKINVDPVVVMQRRRFAKVFASMKHFVAERQHVRARLQKALVAVESHHQRQHIDKWIEWIHHVHAMKVHEVYSSVQMDHFYRAKYFPLFSRNVLQRRRFVLSEEHHHHRLYISAWASWSKYAYVGVRRAKAQARLQAKAKEKEAQNRAAPQYVDDDFSHRKFRTNSSGSIVVPTSPSNKPALVIDTNPVLLVKDFRVSVQHAQWQQGAVMHLVHAILHCLARWRKWCRIQHYHRALDFSLTHRKLGNAISALHTFAVRSKDHRRWRRVALQARRRFLLQHSFRSLLQHQRLSVASRRLARKQTSVIFKQWASKVHFRSHAKSLLADLEVIHHRNMLAVAFREWRIDTRVEAIVQEGIKIDHVHRLHHGLDHFAYHMKVRRRQAALLLRGRKFKTQRLLRKVYTNILAEMAIRYRTVEVLQDCAQYHDRYNCRRVIYNLFYLRRNRIAKDYNLRNSFLRITAALRVNTAVVRHSKGEMKKANAVLLRKTLNFMHRWARVSAYKARKLRALRDFGQRADPMALVRGWNRQNRLSDFIRRFSEITRRKRSRTKLLRLCVSAHVKFHMYRSFRRLLSHARKRNLKRRNSQALYLLFLNMQKRRAVSRLDINVSNQWAHKQELRLMDAHAQRSVLARGMNAVKSTIFGEGLFRSELGRFAEELVLRGEAEGEEGEEESKGSDSSVTNSVDNSIEVM